MSNYTDNQVTDDPNHVWSKILNLVPEKSEILDIGCSSGNLGRVLIKEKNCIIDGVEPDKADADIASKYLRQVWSFSIEDEKNIEKIKRTYDVLIFADVLEHLVHPSEVLKMVKKLLKPGGQVIFSLPNMGHISVRLSLLQGNFKYTETGLLDKTHLHFYDLEEVKNMFGRAGMVLKNFDSSSFDYPDQLINERLKSMGLTANKKGLKMLHAHDAAAFQYVGSAIYSKGASATQQAELKPTSQAVSKDVKIFIKRIAEQEKLIAEKDVHIENLQKHIGDISNRLDELVSSKAYVLGNKIITPYRKTQSKLKRGKRRKL